MNGLETAPSSSTSTRASADLDTRQFWINAWRPSTTESSYEITDIVGEIPREIHGTLYRNGPSQQVLPAEGLPRAPSLRRRRHGARLSLRRRQGVHYTGRVVEHPSTLRERAEGRFCMDSDRRAREGSRRSVPRAAQHQRRLPRRQAHGDGGELVSLRDRPPHARARSAPTTSRARCSA